ncbi:uncharacterized protein GGS22DRAFT_189235 [Annulohypoxylon maeteangense]|uniref:uncharacterized protein n=1 Tax=Annulohypoxylon maeteangense TaxID=1927788 RepID=UPI00200796C3|nr:uncharacterized protein GGS22DRAFT_189235 [Annulohypoxylon maeteangense]KAI0884105.1 hypothetical protein GGS22DRAFT_189235 [Annulohypoxylon maeteangense]
MPLGGKGPTTIAVLSAEAVLSAAFVAMRFYTRKVIKGGVGSDDYLLIMTWFFQALFVALMIASSIYGFGQHTKDISLDDIRVATKIELIGQLVVSLAMGLSKTSVAMFLMRIIITVWHRVVLWFWIVTMMTWSLLLAISCFAQCTPVESIWDERIKTKSCPLNLTNIAFIMCSWSAAMDFFLAAFPWAILWNLNMQRREKVTICVSLSLGIFAGVCGIIRTSGLAVLSQTADYLYATADSVMWTSSELTITIVCVSAPVLRPLWRKLVGRTSTDQSYGNSDRSNEIMTIGRIRKARKTDTELALDTIPRPDIKNTRTTAIGTNRGNLNTGSQQSILRNSQAIQKTKEFTISYEE